MGVELPDCRRVAEILGVKLFVDIVVAYGRLGALIDNKKIFDSHVMGNGTYMWANDDVLLLSNNGSTIQTLKGGIISVSLFSVIMRNFTKYSHFTAYIIHVILSSQHVFYNYISGP